MKFRKKWLAILMVMTMILSLGLTGCGKSNDNEESPVESETIDTPSTQETPENFVELALNVYYNDADHS